jgi:putative DNA methylase
VSSSSAFPKKLIEVAIPLDAINEASAYDKMPGIGAHPKGIHHWWARLPLPCARAILFASLVNDPAYDPKTKNQPETVQNETRKRLFDIINKLVDKSSRVQREAISKAYLEINRSCDGKLPRLLDPFCGGGSIPLEGQRLGLDVLASELNPVAVLITRASIDIIPRFAKHPPVNPDASRTLAKRNDWDKARGLAADVRYYARWVQSRAEKELGNCYPSDDLLNENGKRPKIIAYLWARTIKCQNPACGAMIPLVRSFDLSRRGDCRKWLEPIIDRKTNPPAIRFEIRNSGTPQAGTLSRKGAKCLACANPMNFDVISAASRSGQIKLQLLAIVTAGKGGRVYLSSSEFQEKAAAVTPRAGAPDTDLPTSALGFRIQRYGMIKHRDMFTARQLNSLTVLSDLMRNAYSQILKDATASPDAEKYAQAVYLFLNFAIDRCIDFNNSLCRWSSGNEKVMNLFGRSAIPMMWDFAEANILGEGVGGWLTCSNYVAECIETVPVRKLKPGRALQLDATIANWDGTDFLVSTDPPYYDNIGYADLSDIFYIWLRRSLAKEFPDIFSTILVPKGPELVAAPSRFNGDSKLAREHFESGFRQIFTALKTKGDPRFPMTVYYAFKQTGEAESGENDVITTESGARVSTGWETMLTALITSGFQVVGTWPVRAAQTWRMRAMGANAVASYIVIVCRPLPHDALSTTRREFISKLRNELPNALKRLQSSNIAPVDLAQSVIGPGMAIFSRYSKVLEAEGTQMSVRTSLQIINQELDTFLHAQESEVDQETRFCITWFEEYGMNEGPFGQADVLTRAKNTSIQSLKNSKSIATQRGNVRLLNRSEIATEMDLNKLEGLSVWMCTQVLAQSLDEAGEEGAAKTVLKIGAGQSEAAKELAYRLYSICEKRGWNEDALAYNNLVSSWPAIQEKAGLGSLPQGQRRL